MTRLILIVSFLAAFHPCASAQLAEPEEIEFLVLEALSTNPEIAAELSAMNAADARISQAGTLDSPQLRLTKKEMPGFLTGTAMATSVEFMQMVRFPTKLSLESTIAEIQADHAHHEHLEKVIQVVRNLKSMVAELWYARTALNLNHEDRTLLQQLVKTSETQYSVGALSQSAFLKLQIELAALEAEESRLRQSVVSAESKLRSILNRDARQPIGPIELDSLTASPPPLQTLLRFAEVNRPMLVHDSLQIREASLMVSAAKQEYAPDFTFSVEYMNFRQAPQQRWSVSAGITIPFSPWTLGKASGRVQEAQAQMHRHEALYRSSRNMVESGIRSAYAHVEAATVLETTYRQQLIPQSSWVLSSTISEYRSGKTDYLMLMDSFRMYQMTRREAAMARMNLEQNLADLAFQVGVIDLSAANTLTKENKQ